MLHDKHALSSWYSFIKHIPIKRISRIEATVLRQFTSSNYCLGRQLPWDLVLTAQSLAPRSTLYKVICLEI